MKKNGFMVFLGIIAAIIYFPIGVILALVKDYK